jgi:hypothetical protein
MSGSGLRDWFTLTEERVVRAPNPTISPVEYDTYEYSL